MVLSMVVPMEPFYVCCKELARKLIFLSLLRMLRTKKGYYTDLDIEFTRTMIQELKL